MKFLLVLHLCSFITQTCPNMMYPQGTYDTWSDCAAAGYVLSGKYFSEFDENLVNKEKIAIKFECKDLDIT